MSEIYSDLESLLFRCFITMPVTIAGIPILLKNITESEFQYINDTYFYITDPTEKFDYFVAYSFLQIEGSNILQSRDEFLDDILEIINSWPPETYYEVSSTINNFKNRTEKAISLLESYVYTDISRVKWFTYKHKLLNDSQITGWKGTEQLALSSTQQSWITLNSLEDERHRYDTINDAARFVATVFNYKGMKPINDEEISKRKQELQRRADLVAKVENMHTNKTKDLVPDASSVPMLSPDQRKEMSAQDLINELNFALSGKEDEHTKIVSAYEREVKKMFVDEKERKEKLLLERIETDHRLRPSASAISSSSKFLSDEELEEEIKRRNKEQEETKVESKLPFDPKIQRNFGTMAKLDPEKENYLRKDPLEELVNTLPEIKQKIRNNLINPSTIQSPTFEDIARQTKQE